LNVAATPSVQTFLKLSVAAAIATIVLKTLAWWITDSVGLLSDAMESFVNLASAVFALAMVTVAQLPADDNHPYGHHKAEYFSVVLEGVFIIIAAIAILREAYGAFLSPHAMDAPVEGLAVSAVAALINGAWSWFLIREGRRRRSPALVADGKHILTDVVTSAGVIVGLIAAYLTGIPRLDPILAALVAVNIIWAGWRLIRESLGGLMDEAAPEKTLVEIRQIISAHAEGAIEAHDVRTRLAGRATFIDFHLVVAGSMPVSEAHDICDRIEKALRAKVPDALITIHVEPEEKAKHQGVLVI